MLKKLWWAKQTGFLFSVVLKFWTNNLPKFWQHLGQNIYCFPGEDRECVFIFVITFISNRQPATILATIIRNSFIHKNGNRRYKFLVLGRKGPYFVKEHSDAKQEYTEDDIINMLEFLVDNIFVVFGGKVFKQIVGIPMGTNCAPLLADIFLYSYEAEFIQSLPSTGKKK